MKLNYKHHTQLAQLEIREEFLNANRKEQRKKETDFNGNPSVPQLNYSKYKRTREVHTPHNLLF